MTYYRTGRKPPHRQFYQINKDEFRRLAYRREAIVAELAGMNRNTVWGWTRNVQFYGRRGCTTRERAEAICSVLRVPFERLFVQRLNDVD